MKLVALFLGVVVAIGVMQHPANAKSANADSGDTPDKSGSAPLESVTPPEQQLEQTDGQMTIILEFDGFVKGTMDGLELHCVELTSRNGLQYSPYMKSMFMNSYKTTTQTKRAETPTLPFAVDFTYTGAVFVDYDNKMESLCFGSLNSVTKAFSFVSDEVLPPMSFYAMKGEENEMVETFARFDEALEKAGLTCTVDYSYKFVLGTSTGHYHVYGSTCP